MSTLQQQAEDIDLGRTDPEQPVSGHVRMCKFTPTTSFQMRYPDTTSMQADQGRWPAWLLPQVPGFQRLELDPSYGFFLSTDDGDERNFRSCSLTTLVLREPHVETGRMTRAGRAAEAAGWDVIWDRGSGHGPFSAFKPPRACPGCGAAQELCSCPEEDPA